MKVLLKKWVSRKDFVMLCLVFLTVPAFAHAGGLGIAAIVGLCGLVALAGFPPSLAETNARISLPVRVLFLFLGWAFITSFWSPYQSGETMTNPVKILLGVPVFLLSAYLIKTAAADPKKREILLGMLFVMTLALGCSLLIDQVSGFAISLAIDPVDAGQDPNLRLGDMIQNVGHGTSVLSLLMVPVGVLLWMRGGRGKLAAMVLVGLTLACGFVTNQSASLLGAFGALFIMAIASMRPKFAVWSSFTVGGLALLCAPLLAFFASRLSLDMKAKLPFSWEERVDNWGHIYGKIMEHPFVGHGFDAVRTFNDTHTIRGFEGRALVSLHPHNAGLHIWVETGFVGVALGCLGLYLGARYLTRTDYLTKPQLIAVSGLTMAVAIMASLSYGVWQDWWWASIIYAAALVSFIKHSKTTT